MTTISGHTTRANGTILTAAIYNADHVNHVTNAQALNATKMEGATPPVADGHAVVWNGTSGNLLRTAGFAPVSATVYGADQAANTAALALKAPIASPTFTGLVTAPAGALFKAAGGAEGGEIVLEKPASGTTISGNVSIDLSGNNFRVFDGVSGKGFFATMASLGIQSKLFTDADLANQALAEAGADNASLMTPLRTAQAIAALAQAINLGTVQTFSQSGNTDTGADDVKGAAFVVGTISATAGTPKISFDGGTTYTNLNPLAQNSSCLVFAKAGVVVQALHSGLGVARFTPTPGTGTINFSSNGAGPHSVIRIL